MVTVILRRTLEGVEQIVIDGHTFARGEKVYLTEKEVRKLPKLNRLFFRYYKTLATDLDPYAGSLAFVSSPLDVTVIIPQYKTPSLTRNAVESMRSFYPHVHMILADDGSQDDSTDYILSVAADDPEVESLILDHNIGQGAIVHLAIERVNTSRFFVMDSDCVVFGGGFLELMETRMIEKGRYGVGVMYHRDVCRNNRYLSCVASMYDTAIYHTLPPFIHHGHPMQQNMTAAMQRGYEVEAFPIFDFIEHIAAGTRRAYGGEWDLTCVSKFTDQPT